MFERFTDEARRVVVVAQEEARAAGDPAIDGAHLLVGLAATGGPAAAALRDVGVDGPHLRDAVRAVGAGAGPLDAEALAALGIDLDRVQRAAEALFGSGALDRAARGRRRRPAGHLPFTGNAKRALSLSLHSAVRRGDGSVDGRHLLLGVLGAGERRTAAVLARLGVDEADLRRRLEDDSAA